MVPKIPTTKAGGDVPTDIAQAGALGEGRQETGGSAQGGKSYNGNWLPSAPSMAELFIGACSGTSLNSTWWLGGRLK